MSDKLQLWRRPEAEARALARAPKPSDEPSLPVGLLTRRSATNQSLSDTSLSAGSLCLGSRRGLSGDLEFAALAFPGFRRRHRHLKHTVAEIRRCRIRIDAFRKRYSAREATVAAFAAVIALLALFVLLLSFAINCD